MIGWEKRVFEPAAPGQLIAPATSIDDGWQTVQTWSKEEALRFRLLGKAYLYEHVGGIKGDPALPGPVALSFPTSAMVQWLRASSDGLTQRRDLKLGSLRRFADDGIGPETLTIDDFPLRFQVWQTGGVLVVTKVITDICVPATYIGAKLAGITEGDLA